MRCYEVDGVTYFCDRAWNYGEDGITEIDPEVISDDEMFAAIAEIQSEDNRCC